MRQSDVAAVSAVHLAAFPTFFLTWLGPRFLRALYRTIVDDEHGIAFVATRGDQIVGFVAGTADKGFYRRARRRWLHFAAAAVGALVRRPSMARRLIRALWSPPGITSNAALLMSLAVDPCIAGTGVGTRLTETFVQRARERGAPAVALTTDGVGNDVVHEFYRRRGFTLAAGYVTAEGRAMNEYILHIQQS